MKHLAKTYILFVCLVCVFSLQSIEAADLESKQAINIKALQWEGYLDPSLMEVFKKKIKKEMGIDLTFTIDNLIDEKLFFNRARSQSVDIIFPGVDISVDPSFQLKEQGLVLPLDIERIPNYKNIVAEQQKPKHLIFQDKLYGVPFVMGQVALFYNTKKVKLGELKDIKTFLQKAKPGSLGTIDFSPHTLYVLAMALGYKKEDISNYDKISQDKNFLEVLKLWRHKATVIFDEGVDTIEKTKDLNAFISWGYTIRELVLKYNQNWKSFDFKHGTITWVDNIMVTSRVKQDSKKLDIIYRLINFILSKDYQQNILLKKLACLPVNEEALKGINQIKGVRHLQHLSNKRDKFFLPPLKDRRTRNGFLYLWKKALD